MNNNDKVLISEFTSDVDNDSLNTVTININPNNRNNQAGTNNMHSYQNRLDTSNTSNSRDAQTRLAAHSDSLAMQNIEDEHLSSNFNPLRLLRRNFSDVLSVSTTPTTEVFRSLFRSHSSGTPASDNGHDNQAISAATSIRSVRTNYSAVNSDGNFANINVPGRQLSLASSAQNSTATTTDNGWRNSANNNGIDVASTITENIVNNPQDSNAQPVAMIAVQDNERSETSSTRSDYGRYDFIIRSDMTAMCLHFYALLCLLALKFLLEHLLGIVDLVIYNVAFFYLSMSLRNQISKHLLSSYLCLIRDACAILCLIYFRFSLSMVPPDPFGLIIPPPMNTLNLEVLSSSDQNLSLLNRTALAARVKPLIELLAFSEDDDKAMSGTDMLQVTSQISTATLIYYVAISDTVIRMATVFIKIIITMFPIQSAHLKSRARFYVIVESISQLYRSLVPLRAWMEFIVSSSSGVSTAILTFVYLLVKCFEVTRRMKQLKASFANFLSKIHTDSTPTSEDLDSIGSTCPICQNSFESPMKLECGHIFCSDCVSKWLMRKQTCPMCRAVISDDPNWQDGSTSLVCQLC